MASFINSSFASPAANADYVTKFREADSGLLARLYSGLDGWTVAITILLMLVAYDQSMSVGDVGPSLS